MCATHRMRVRYSHTICPMFSAVCIFLSVASEAVRKVFRCNMSQIPMSFYPYIDVIYLAPCSVWPKVYKHPRWFRQTKSHRFSSSTHQPFACPLLAEALTFVPLLVTISFLSQSDLQGNDSCPENLCYSHI